MVLSQKALFLNQFSIVNNRFLPFEKSGAGTPFETTFDTVSRAFKITKILRVNLT
jgi:hypothetical protein